MSIKKAVLAPITIILAIAVILSGCVGGGGSKLPVSKFELTISVEGQGSVVPQIVTSQSD